MNILKQEDVITPLNMKDVFEIENGRTEEGGMSPFIVDNIDQISEMTGYDLEVVNTEVFVGKFRADIVCKDINTNDIVIIENQIDKSDHDHIGKAITYLSNLDAKAIIWICDQAQPEHIKAIEKLNEITFEDYNFYMFELKFNKFNKDTALYSFNNIVVPNTINKLANEIKGNKSENLLNIINLLSSFTKNIKEKINTAKYDNKHRYMFLFNNHNKCHLAIYIMKDMNVRFEFICNSDNFKPGKDIDEFLNELSEKLNSNGKYNFTLEIGPKNPVYHKMLYVTNLNIANDENEIEKTAIDIYNQITGFIK